MRSRRSSTKHRHHPQSSAPSDERNRSPRASSPIATNKSTVLAVRRYNRVQPVFDLITIEGVHTYHVQTGSVSVLVHNHSRPPRQYPNPDAEGPHTTFMLDGNGEVKKYATWVAPSDSRDPRPFILQKRFDRYGAAHPNKDGTVVETSHINLPDGSARSLEDWEKPRGCP